MNKIKTISAYVGPSMLRVADRLFQGNLLSIISELSQNSRRAGANSISIEVRADPTTEGSVISITDDGGGMQDPTALLGLSDSAYADAKVLSEDPAGMGFFVLSGRPWARVESWDWNMTLRPESFKGEPVDVLTSSYHVAGMRVDFAWHESCSQAKVSIRNVAVDFLSLCGLSVTVDGEPVAQHDFLRERDGVSTRMAEWPDLGVSAVAMQLPASHHHMNRNNQVRCNFHGFVCAFDTQSVPGSTARVQIHNADHIKLVLPERKELVDNTQLHELMDRVERLRYSEIASRPDGHKLPFSNYSRALELGVSISPALPILRLYDSAFGGLVSVDLRAAKGLVMRGPQLDRYGPREMLSAALDGNLDVRIFLNDESMEGYEWYDSLPYLVSAHAVCDGAILVENGYCEDEMPDGYAVCDWDDAPSTGTTGVLLVYDTPTATGADRACVMLDADVLLRPADDRSWAECLPSFVVGKHVTASCVSSVVRTLEEAWMPREWDEDDCSDRWSDLAHAQVLTAISPCASVSYGVRVARDAACSALTLPDTTGLTFRDVSIVLSKSAGRHGWVGEWQSRGVDRGRGDYKLAVRRIVVDEALVEIPGADNLADAIAAASLMGSEGKLEGAFARISASYAAHEQGAASGSVSD